MSDIEKSFTYLQDNIPQWLQDITSVEEKVAVILGDVTEVQISQSPFGKRRSDSIESIRPAKLDAIVEDTGASNTSPAEPNISRKRKTPSVSSGRVSDSSRYRPHRSRTMIVVSYDGDVQKAFELLVRSIGTGRNMLRKAKMEARMNEMAARAESSEEEDEDDDGEEDVSQSRINYRARMSSLRARSAARRSGRLGVSSGSPTPAELFDATDKTLEQAQELCEKAAHLTLRDGDCRKELEGVRTHFQSLLETAKTEVTKCNTRKLHDPPELHAHDTSDTSVSSIEPETSYRKHAPQATLPEPTPESLPKTTDPNAPTSSMPPKIVDMEVDDDDDDDEPFIMPPVRLTSRFNRRG